MENKAALRAKGENRMLQKSQEEPEKKEQRISDIHTHVLPGLAPVFGCFGNHIGKVYAM